MFLPLMRLASSGVLGCSLPYQYTCGGGDPPTDEHVRLSTRPSVAVGFEAGLILGGDGFRRTVGEAGLLGWLKARPKLIQ